MINMVSRAHFYWILELTQTLKRNSTTSPSAIA
ncbi:MAG: hypothetical protein QOH52_2365 [Pseudonocardiales bacterium]|nr:hypothetical protein [Pseudonocardiales bacterium]